MSAETRTCNSCGHGVEVPLRMGAVECRALPPNVLLLPGQGLVSAFPQCHGGMSCGYWAPKGVDVMEKAIEKTTEKPKEKAHGET